MSEPLPPGPIAADEPSLGADPPPHVFVSYASGDRPHALAVTRALEGAGVPAWIDVAGIGGGQSYGPEIVDGIRDCGALVLLCSAVSLSSRNVRQEIALAWRFDRPILPLRLEPVEFPDTLVYWLEGAQWIDVFDDPEEAWLPAALRALDRFAASPAREPLQPTADPTGTAQAILPVPPTPLLGRDPELADICRRLDGGARLLTLTGPGGTGKTRLALEAARAVAEGFPGGAVFIDLAPVTDPALVLAAVAAALGVREGIDRPLAEELRAYMRSDRLLLVLDNLEQVLGAAGDIAGLLAFAPGLVVLATSRAPLGVRAEEEIAVGPLPLPPAAGTPDQVAAAPAGALFLERARAAGADIALTDANAGIDRRDRAASGRAAARDRAGGGADENLPPEALLRRLEKRLPLLTGGASRPARARSGRCGGRSPGPTVCWRAEEQVAFRRLAVFAGGCSFEAVEAVVAGDGQVDPYEALAALVRQSLLRQERAEGEPRFAMLETIREYAAEQLEASGEGEAIRGRHAPVLPGHHRRRGRTAPLRRRRSTRLARPFGARPRQPPRRPGLGGGGRRRDGPAAGRGALPVLGGARPPERRAGLAGAGAGRGGRRGAGGAGRGAVGGGQPGRVPTGLRRGRPGAGGRLDPLAGARGPAGRRPGPAGTRVRRAGQGPVRGGGGPVRAEPGALSRGGRRARGGGRILPAWRPWRTSGATSGARPSCGRTPPRGSATSGTAAPWAWC